MRDHVTNEEVRKRTDISTFIIDTTEAITQMVRYIPKYIKYDMIDVPTMQEDRWLDIELHHNEGKWESQERTGGMSSCSWNAMPWDGMLMEAMYLLLYDCQNRRLRKLGCQK